MIQIQSSTVALQCADTFGRLATIGLVSKSFAFSHAAASITFSKAATSASGKFLIVSRASSGEIFACTAMMSRYACTEGQYGLSAILGASGSESSLYMRRAAFNPAITAARAALKSARRIAISAAPFGRSEEHTSEL